MEKGMVTSARTSGGPSGAHWDHQAQSVDKPSAARCGILNYTSKMLQMECRHPGMFSGRGLTEFSGADQSFVEAREHSAACC